MSADLTNKADVTGDWNKDKNILSDIWQDGASFKPNLAQ